MSLLISVVSLNSSKSQPLIIPLWFPSLASIYFSVSFQSLHCLHPVLLLPVAFCGIYSAHTQPGSSPAICFLHFHIWSEHYWRISHTSADWHHCCKHLWFNRTSRNPMQLFFYITIPSQSSSCLIYKITFLKLISPLYPVLTVDGLASYFRYEFFTSWLQGFCTPRPTFSHILNSYMIQNVQLHQEELQMLHFPYPLLPPSPIEVWRAKCFHFSAGTSHWEP